MKQTAQTSEQARSILSGLKDRIQEAHRVRAVAAARRSEIAFRASQGNAAAQEELARLRVEDERALRAIDDVELAMPAARAQLDEAVARESALLSAEQLVEAHAAADALVDVSREVDEAIAALGVTLERHREAVRTFVRAARPRNFLESSMLSGFDTIGLALAFTCREDLNGLLRRHVSTPTETVEDRAYVVTNRWRERHPKHLEGVAA
jgi:hypothetical protein